MTNGMKCENNTYVESEIIHITHIDGGLEIHSRVVEKGKTGQNVY